MLVANNADYKLLQLGITCPVSVLYKYLSACLIKRSSTISPQDFNPSTDNVPYFIISLCLIQANFTLLHFRPFNIVAQLFYSSKFENF